VSTLNVGDPAPDFTVPDDSGNPLTLSALRGRPVVLYFYPRDDTPGCTAQACSLRDSWPEIVATGAALYGISTDSEESHRRFRGKYSLPFPLLADTEHAVADAYGTWVEKNNYGKKSMGIERSTFLIDGQGTVREVWRKVQVPGHVDAVLAAARSLT
jgi:thioredoxin-dependent peroxiredoxin